MPAKINLILLFTLKKLTCQLQNFSTMTDMITDDFTGENQKLPSGLNILTILTIIGSILGLLSGFWNYYNAESGYNKTKEALEPGNLEKIPSWARGFVSPEMLELQHKMLINKLPILILALVGSALCLYGALEMRKRKKQGYLLWLIGEVLPILSSVLFVGIASLKGVGIIAVAIPVLFIILYTVNKKELIY